MAKKCCIESCCCTESDGNVSFFKFPTNTGQQLDWYSSICSETGQTVFREDEAICSEHFAESFLQDPMNPSAIPFSGMEIPAKRIKKEKISPNIQCAMFSCPNIQIETAATNPNLCYHSFPSDPELADKWSLFSGSLESTPEYYLCSEHFTIDDYRIIESANGKKIRIFKSSAVPTLRPIEIKCEEPQIHDPNAMFLNSDCFEMPASTSSYNAATRELNSIEEPNTSIIFKTMNAHGFPVLSANELSQSGTALLFYKWAEKAFERKTIEIASLRQRMENQSENIANLAKSVDDFKARQYVSDEANKALQNLFDKILDTQYDCI